MKKQARGTGGNPLKQEAMLLRIDSTVIFFGAEKSKERPEIRWLGAEISGGRFGSAPHVQFFVNVH